MTALSMPVVWGITIAVLLVVEAATMGLTTIWFAGGALAALILAILHAPIWLQIGVFAAVSILLLFMTRPLAAAFLTRNKTRTNAESLIGQEAVVIERIDNVQGTGHVRVSGMEWTARSVRADQTIEEGEIVMARAIEGVKLIVGKRITEPDVV